MPLTAISEPAVTRLPGRDPAHAQLVANAVHHGEGPVEARLSFAAGDLRIEVHDEGAGRPVRRQASCDDECGRGLEVVDGLIKEHGGSITPSR